LLKQGRIIRGYLGIQARQSQSGQIDDNSEGVVVDDVIPGSPAAEAQLQRGDVIRKFDGHDVGNFPTLRTLVAQAGLNKKIELEILRQGKPVKVTTEIKEQPVDYPTARVAPRQQQPRPQNPQVPDDQETEGGPLDSIQVGELTPEVASQLNIPNGVHGVVITKVDENANSGLQAGDVIEEINQQPVTSVASFKKMAGALDPNGTQVLSVCRQRTRSFVVLRPG